MAGGSEMSRDLAWITEANRHLGLTEVPGARSSPVILRWLRRLGAWWFDDATPWCGTFVAHCFATTGYPMPEYWMRARAWAGWGVSLREPLFGCIAVFERQGGGHVGFVVGRDRQGRLMVLGGNQGDRVCVMPFDPARVLAFRWPAELPAKFGEALPLLTDAAPQAEGEA